MTMELLTVIRDCVLKMQFKSRYIESISNQFRPWILLFHSGFGLEYTSSDFNMLVSFERFDSIIADKTV